MVDQTPVVKSDDASRLRNDKVLIQIPPLPDETWITRIEKQYAGLEIRWEQLDWKPGDSTEAGAVDLSSETWEGVTIACLFIPHTAHLMSNVRFVQLTSAGVDKWCKHETYKDPNVTICTASGVQSPQISEWVISTWLMMRNGYLDYSATQRQAQASKALPHVQDTPGMRMGILGYGAIGRQCGRVAAAMGVQVYAFTRNPRTTTAERRDRSYSLPGMGDPQGSIPSAWYHGTSQEAVDDFLHQDLDILVLCLPLTESNRHLIGRAQFDILAKKKTFLSNVARGQLVVTDALVEALNQGKIQGAALDVTDPEPLPDGHPLYTAPNVFITPHVSFRTQNYFQRILDVFEANLERLSKGQPLLNEVSV
ncbi:MAG: hypothetical protein M1828_001126 [Chrysothrix sp. TS-e1954]|nr:MAG: hypothetical protein M1828_001126 [Chrysothrix sp. TS-e1954]